MSEIDPRKEVYEWRECVSCNKRFYISVAEKEYFAGKSDEQSGRKFELPKRCYNCRVKRRQEKGSHEGQE